MPEPAPERANKLVIRKIMPAPREKVFAAWLEPEGMRSWMCPGNCRSAEVEIDARVGGKFRILMKSEEKDYDHIGEYVVIDPPSKLVFTWISEGTDHQPTLVTIELFDRGKECELVLTHERFPRPDNVESHRKGWGSIVEKLALHLQAAPGR